jgi:site-specific DNA-methyltransferase (adenine-specific)
VQTVARSQPSSTRWNGITEAEQDSWSELQNEPQQDHNESRAWLNAQDLADGRNVKIKRGLIPRDYHKLVCSIDVQQSLLYYSVMALKDDGSGHLVRYGTWPEQEESYFTLREARKKLRNKYRNRSDMAALSEGITDLADWLFSREWLTEDGGSVPMEAVGCDARWKGEIVKQALARSDHANRLYAYLGHSYRAADKPISERKYDHGSRVGLGWVIKKRKSKSDVKSVTVDVNFWKTALQDQLAARVGSPGAVTIYDGKHRMLAEHITSEFGTPTEGRGRTVIEWRLKPGHAGYHGGLPGLGFGLGLQCAGVQRRGGEKAKATGPQKDGGQDVTLYHRDKSTEIHNGDCLQVLRTLPDSSVDACVTDPPYGLAFMGKRWDYDVPGVELWQEVLRVLKPGGHLLAFAGTRTQHRMAVRIEDAGFEIRDMIAWVYGSGFPKSLDVSKAIDKAAGAEREVVATETRYNEASGIVSAGRDERTLIECKITAPATESAKQWDGWGTALKPALEPITVARKPFTGTVAANVLEHGTGALNVDGGRVGTESTIRPMGGKATNRTTFGTFAHDDAERMTGGSDSGRWPANLIHDGSEEVVGLFPETAPAKAGQRGAGINGATFKAPEYESTERGHDDAGGSAARFFYCAKASADERRNSKHPTIKPVALMRYLVRLVCPAGGVVLDPFAGSGTTIEAARLEHCRAVGIEREAEYCADILERLRQGVLF